MVHNTRREAARVLARFQKQIVLLRRTTAEAASVEHTKLQVREGRKSTEDDWQGFPYPNTLLMRLLIFFTGVSVFKGPCKKCLSPVRKEQDW
jgi:hypothetical protein